MGKNRNKHSKERKVYTHTRTQNLSKEELQSQLSDNSKKIATGCATILVTLVFAVALSFLTALVFMYAWNLGIAVAFGMAPIGYWTAFWIIAALSIIGSCLHKKDIDLDLFNNKDE